MMRRKWLGVVLTVVMCLSLFGFAGMSTVAETASVPCKITTSVADFSVFPEKVLPLFLHTAD